MKSFILLASGVGGAGKDSVIEILNHKTDQYLPFLSYTDKTPRADETPGKTYHYISQEQFDNWITENKFLEWEQVRGKYRYGRLKADFDQLMQSGKPVYFHLDVLGAEKFRKMGLDIVSVFIVPPSREEAKRRMEKRGTDTPEQLQNRLNRYDFEMSFKDKYDYIIVNDDLQKAQQELLSIIEKEQKARE